MSVRALAVVIAPNLFNFELDSADPLSALTFSQKAVCYVLFVLPVCMSTYRGMGQFFVHKLWVAMRFVVGGHVTKIAEMAAGPHTPSIRFGQVAMGAGIS